jgi:hypothetical protein
MYIYDSRTTVHDAKLNLKKKRKSRDTYITSINNNIYSPLFKYSHLNIIRAFLIIFIHHDFISISLSWTIHSNDSLTIAE